MALITQDEILETVRVDDHYSVNKILDSDILKAELLLANEFLGETFYNELEADKSTVGTFATAKFQTLYDTYLKKLLSEYVMLQTIPQQVLELRNAGLGSENVNVKDLISALERYQIAMQDEVSKSMRLIHSFMMDKTYYSNYLGNNGSSTATQTTKSKIVFGFYIED